jgi:adenylate cyclase
MNRATTTTERAATPLLIVFLDLTLFAAQSHRTGDAELAETINEYYEILTTAADAAGGTIVKFIGDAALAVFPEHAIDAGVQMALDLTTSVDAFMANHGWECRLRAKVHFGSPIAGQFGPEGSARFDVIGRAVNTAAMLPSTGLALSAEAFEKLSPKLRARFKQQGPPITYVGL